MAPKILTGCVSLPNKNHQRKYIWTRKYINEKGVPREQEETITQEEASRRVRNTTGKILLKQRIEWHGSIAITAEHFLEIAIALDTVSHIHNVCFWEFEALEPDEERKELINKLFEEIVIKSGIAAELTDLTMSKASIHFDCTSLEDLLEYKPQR